MSQGQFVRSGAKPSSSLPFRMVHMQFTTNAPHAVTQSNSFFIFFSGRRTQGSTSQEWHSSTQLHPEGFFERLCRSESPVPFGQVDHHSSERREQKPVRWICDKKSNEQKVERQKVESRSNRQNVIWMKGRQLIWTKNSGSWTKKNSVLRPFIFRPSLCSTTGQVSRCMFESLLQDLSCSNCMGTSLKRSTLTYVGLSVACQSRTGSAALSNSENMIWSSVRPSVRYLVVTALWTGQAPSVRVPCNAINAFSPTTTSSSCAVRPSSIEIKSRQVKRSAPPTSKQVDVG